MRNYKLEYKRFQSKTGEKKRRALRNKARRLMLKKGLVHKGDRMDVHHSKSSSLSLRGIKAISRSKNRAYQKSRTGKNLGLR
jgi:predicted RNA-binding protein with PUA-like domain